MIERKKYYIAILLTLLLGIGTAPLASLAATPTENVDTDNETPAFTSPAQAQHAASLAEQAASSEDSVKDAMQDVQEAQNTLDTAMQNNDPAAIDEAREALAKAESGYVESLADITGVIGDDISSLRDSGMGWGEIAHELGVQPGLLGLGHTRGEQNHSSRDMAAEPAMYGIDQQEFAEATARNMESGWSRGHGVGLQTAVHDSGTGLSDRSSGGDMGGSGHASTSSGQSSSHGGVADNSGGRPDSTSGGSNGGGHSAAGPDHSASSSSSSSGGSNHPGGTSSSNSSGSSSEHGSSSDRGDHGGSEGMGR